MKPRLKEKQRLEHLAEELQEEKERHKEAENIEEKRHEANVESIKRSAGLDQIQALKKRIQTLQDQRNNKLQELEKDLKNIILSTATRQRQTLGTTATIRDNDLYIYDNTGTANVKTLKHIGTNRASKKDLKDVIKDDYGEEIIKSLKKLQKINIKTSYGSHIRIQKTEEINDTKYSMKTSEPNKIDIGTGYSKTRIDSTRIKQIKTIVKHKNEIQEIMTTLEEELENSIEKIDNIQEDITNRHSKRLTAEKL